MEELRSTDTLDKEILEDARKKADRILRTADQNLKSLTEEWSNKTVKTIADLERIHVDAGVKHRSEVMARLPLDKRRARSQRTEGLLRSAMEECISHLPRKRLFLLLEQELKARVQVLPSQGITVRFGGMERKEAEALLKVCFPGAASACEVPETPSPSSGYPELILDSPEVRVVVSISARMEELLKDRRGELTRALLGEGAIND
jgi:V/A-type H+-transporting ATPase subunit E